MSSHGFVFPHSWPVRSVKSGHTGTVTVATADLGAKPLTGYKIALGWSLFWSAPPNKLYPSVVHWE